MVELYFAHMCVCVCVYLWGDKIQSSTHDKRDFADVIKDHDIYILGISQICPKCNPKCPFKKEVEGNLIRKDKMVI